MGVLLVIFVVALAVSAGVLYGLKWVRNGGISRFRRELEIKKIAKQRHEALRLRHPDWWQRAHEHRVQK